MVTKEGSLVRIFTSLALDEHVLPFTAEEAVCRIWQQNQHEDDNQSVTPSDHSQTASLCESDCLSSDSGVEVELMQVAPEDDVNNPSDYAQVPLFEVTVENWFVGRDQDIYTGKFLWGKAHHGANILLQLGGNQYWHIARDIIAFELPAPVDAYLCPLGNNDVPYPCILSGGKIYVLWEPSIPILQDTEENRKRISFVNESYEPLSEGPCLSYEIMFIPKWFI
jgi:hypothetical protein